jgi:hypothetical protein
MSRALRVRDTDGTDVAFNLTFSNASKSMVLFCFFLTLSDSARFVSDSLDAIFVVPLDALVVGQAYEIVLPKDSAVLQFGGKSATEETKRFAASLHAGGVSFLFSVICYCGCNIHFDYFS